MLFRNPRSYLNCRLLIHHQLVKNKSNCGVPITVAPLDLIHTKSPLAKHREPSVLSTQSQNVQSLCEVWTELFQSRRIGEPRVSAELIVAHVIGLKTLHGIPTWQILSQKQVEKINSLCSIRADSHMPVQYVIGEWDFLDMTLQMKAPVLIPRPETEQLVEHITSYYQLSEGPIPEWILDIGTGSGAIVLALAKRFPTAQAIAIDKSKIACELTRKNANNHTVIVHVEQHELREGNMQDIDVLRREFDIIVSNPPYIKTSDLFQLPPDIYRHEDVEGALDGGEDGLSIVKVILSQARHVMHKESTLWLEVCGTNIQLIPHLITNNPHWQLQLVKTFTDFRDVKRFCLFKLSTR